MPNGQSAAQIAEETQRRLGQKIYTTPPNVRDPYRNSDTPDTDRQAAPAPQTNVLAFVTQNKEALKRMPPDKAARFVNRLFTHYVLPRYQQVNQQRPLDEDELERLRLQFASRMFDIPYEAETKLKEEKREPGLAERAGAVAEAAGAGVIGGLRTVEQLRENLRAKLGPLGKALEYDPVNILAKKAMTPAGKAEARAYEEAKTVTPRGAEIGAAVGHQIPAAIAAEGAGAVMPRLAAGAPLALRTAESAARGGVEATSFEAARPGGDPSAGAGWGMALGAAFPMLGRMFNLGRRAVPRAAEIAEAPAAKAATAEAPKTLGQVADAAAKSKFGKSFKDLTPAEKAQMPSVMKEEIAKQQAQKAATKKAERAAAKVSKEAEAEATRLQKAEAAKQKAATQAAKRSVTGAATPAQREAVAAQAAAENISAAKVAAPVERRAAEGISPTGVERRKTLMKGVTTAYDVPTPGEKLAGEIRAARAGEPTKITEGEALQHIMKDPARYETYKAADTKTQGKMLVDAKRELETAPTVTKVPAEAEGKKVRAKGGKPASPAQQAADRERIAKKRAEAKQEEFGAALEKHAQEMAGRHTAGSVGMMHIPELEDTMKEFPNGELFLRGFQKLRRAGRITDEIYVEEMKNWLMEQFEKGGEKAAD